MKRMLKAVALSLLLISGSLLQNTATAQYYNEDREVSYQTFYDELSPYGQWVDYPNYGYVWVPQAEPDFRPYSTNGHWVWTDNYEWMWVSDYDWGWAPFHYGRWDHDSRMGWYWVPGYEWSSAWVAWRDGGDYYGWAPIRPGINISINFNIGGYNPPDDFWCFAPRRYINSPRIHDYYLDRRQNVTIIHQTTIIINNYNYGNSYGFRSGPRRYDAERYCGTINPVRFRDSYNPGRTTFRNNEVSIYRPRVQQDNSRQFAPRNVERYDGNSNTGFRRNDNTRNDNNAGQQNNNANNNTERRRFDRTDDGVTQQQNNNGNNNGSVDRRRFDRNNEVRQPQTNNGNNTQPDRRQIDRNDNQQPQRQPPIRYDQQQQNTGNNDRRQIDRNDNQQPQRQPPIRYEQQQQNTGNNDRRRFERTDNQQPQRQPQQIERRQEQRQQPQQVERRPQQQQQPQPQPSQQQPRQFERKDNGNSQQNNNGNGNGRRRF